MLVQSYLDAFLATVVKLKLSLRASPRVLFRCCFSSRPTSRSSLAPVPLGSTIFPSELSRTSRVDIRLRPLDSLESPLSLRAARPTSRLFSGPACPSFLYIYIYCGDRARSAYPSLCYISTSPHLYMIVSTLAVVYVLLGSFTL